MMKRTTIRAAALAIATVLAAFGATTAAARQCVVNSGGYIIDVKWFPADAIHLDDKSKIATSKPAKQSKASIPIGQSSCNETNEQLTAVVAVAGCLSYVPANGKGPVSCALDATRGPTEVLPGTLSASASCEQGCMHYPYVATKTRDDAAIGLGYGFQPSIIVVGTIPAGKSLELSGTTGRVTYGIK
jgi:hypothetical protein